MISSRRNIWQHLLWWRFRLFQQHRHRRPAIESVSGRAFLVLPGVMNPVLFRTGPFLASQLTCEEIGLETSVLDLGTGCGILAIFAAMRSQKVTALDINSRSTRCAHINAILNEVDARVHVVQGDLFTPLAGKRFDLILFNPPFYNGKPQNSFDTAWRAENIAMRFAAGLSDHLEQAGSALIVLSSRADQLPFFSAFRIHDLDMTTVAQKDLRNEILTIFRLRRR